MRLQKLVMTSWVAVLAAGATFVACNKSDGDGDGDKNDGSGEVTEANKADATKASVATATALSSLGSTGGGGAGMISTETRLRIRELYRQNKAKMAMLLDDGTSDPGTFEITCGMLYSAETCDLLSETPPSLGEGGPSCTATCPEGGGLNFACTIDSYDVKCGADTYTLTEGTANSSMTCVDNDDGSMTLTTASDSNVKMKGGTITEAVELKCSFSMDMKLDFNGMGDGETGEDAFNTDQLCESFSCTVGGVAISCEEMKSAIDANSCGEAAAE